LSSAIVIPSLNELIYFANRQTAWIGRRRRQGAAHLYLIWLENISDSHMSRQNSIAGAAAPGPAVIANAPMAAIWSDQIFAAGALFGTAFYDIAKAKTHPPLAAAAAKLK
jgi:hypothetical protein